MEINSFNQLFAEARERRFLLTTLHQQNDGQFVANWRRGDAEPRAGETVVRVHPFNAARGVSGIQIENSFERQTPFKVTFVPFSPAELEANARKPNGEKK